MGKYEVALPDGRMAVIEADTPDAALAYAETVPKSKKAAEKSTYSAELMKQRKELAASRKTIRSVGGEGVLAAATPIMSPIMGEVAGGAYALGNEAANLFRAPDEKVSSRAVYEGNRDAVDEDAKDLRANYPGLSLAGDIYGAVRGGGLLAKGGKFLAGLKPVAAATKAAKATKAAQVASKATAAATKAAPRTTRYVTRVAKASASGAAGGAAYGATEGRTAQERAKNAGKGAAFGAGAGVLLEGVGAPAVERLGKVAKDVARPALDRLRGPAAAKARDAKRAAANAAMMAKDKGVTPEAMDALKDEGLDATLAEAMGTEGVNTQMSLARRPGGTGDAMRAQVRERNMAQPGGIFADTESMLGVNPQHAARDVEAMVEAGKERAGPLFDEALAGEHGVTTPEIERLLATKYGRKLAAGVEERAQKFGDEASGLTMGRVAVPEPVPGAHPMDAPDVGDELVRAGDAPPDLGPAPVVPIPRAPSQEPQGRGLSLSEWFKQRGGLKTPSGELGTRGLPETMGSRSRLTPGGTGEDEMAMAARDAGYFPDWDVPPTRDDLLDALAADAAGIKKRYPKAPDEGAMARWNAAEAARGQQREIDTAHSIRQQDAEAEFRTRQEADAANEADWQRRSADFEDPDDYASLRSDWDAPESGPTGANAPRYEHVDQEAYTPKSLDALRRAANDEVKWEFGKLKQGAGNKAKHAFSKRFAAAVADDPAALPKLRKAIDAGGDYKRIDEAFEHFSGKLTTTSDRDFANDWLRLKGGEDGAERWAARAALANDIRDLWAKGQLRGGKFTLPGVKEKLRLAFGDGADAFVAKMERRAELAASGNRMAPYSGSPSTPLLEAGAATDKAAVAEPEMLARVIGKFAGGKPLAAIGDLGSTLLLKAIRYPESAGSSVAYRDELGRILGLKPAEAAAWLREMAALPEPVRRDYAVQLGLVAGRGAGAKAEADREPIPAQ